MKEHSFKASLNYKSLKSYVYIHTVMVRFFDLVLLIYVKDKECMSTELASYFLLCIVKKIVLGKTQVTL